MLSFPMEIPKTQLDVSKATAFQMHKTSKGCPPQHKNPPRNSSEASNRTRRLETETHFLPPPPKHPYITNDYVVYNLFTYVYYQTTQPSVKVTFPLTWSTYGIGHSPKPLNPRHTKANA